MTDVSIDLSTAFQDKPPPTGKDDITKVGAPPSIDISDPFADEQLEDQEEDIASDAVDDVDISDPFADSATDMSTQDMYNQRVANQAATQYLFRPPEPVAPEGFTSKTYDELTDVEKELYVPDALMRGTGPPTFRSLEKYREQYDILEKEYQAAIAADDTKAINDVTREQNFLLTEFEESYVNPNIRYIIPDNKITNPTNLERVSSVGDSLTVMQVFDTQKRIAEKDEFWTRSAKYWDDVVRGQNLEDYRPGEAGNKNYGLYFKQDAYRLIEELFPDMGIGGTINGAVLQPIAKSLAAGGQFVVSALDLGVYAVQDVIEETVEALGAPTTYKDFLGSGRTLQVGEAPRDFLKGAWELSESIAGMPFHFFRPQRIVRILSDRKVVRNQIKEQGRLLQDEKRAINFLEISQATAGARLKKTEAAAKLAEENEDIAIEIARGLEETLGVTGLVARRRIGIGTDAEGKPKFKTDADGEFEYKETVDYDRIAEVGQDELDRLRVQSDEVAGFTVDEGVTATTARGAEEVLPVAEVLDDLDEIRSGVLRTALNVDMLKKYVAVAADLRAVHPLPKGKKVSEWLFETMSQAEDLDDPVLRDLVGSVNKFGIDFPTFAAMVYSNYSSAGKTLATISRPFNRFKKAAHPLDEEFLALEAMKKTESAFMAGARRLENMRRGLLVSAFKTASRNLQSGLIRAPFEGLTNVFTEMLVSIGRGDYKQAYKELMPLSLGLERGTSIFVPLNRLGEGLNIRLPIGMSEEWTYSFGQTRLLLDRYNNAEDLQNLTRLLLSQDEFKTKYRRFYQNYNEIQQIINVPAPTTRAGKIADAIIREGEDLTWTLNAPNRFQEFIFREAHFMGEMIRLTKKEWDVDLVDELLKGRMDDFLADAEDLRKNSSFRFENIVEEATEGALRATYAGAPQTAFGKWLNQGVTKFFGTLATPFPRYMITSMELLGNMGAGAPIALARMAFAGRKLKDRQSGAAVSRQIATNITGALALTTAWQFRNSEFAGAAYDEILLAGKKLNIGPVFFMPQMLMIAEATKKFLAGDPMPITKREAIQVLTGTGFRPNQLIDGVTGSLLSALEDEGLDWDRAGALAVGGLIGEIGASVLQPFTMGVDLARAIHYDPDLSFEDHKPDPSYNNWDAFAKGFVRPFKVKGFGLTNNKDIKQTIDRLIEEQETEAGLTPERFMEIAREIEQLESQKIRERVSPSRPDAAKRGSPLLNFLGFSLFEPDTEQQAYLKDLGLEDYIIGGQTGIGSIDSEINEYLNDHVPNIVNQVMALGKQNNYSLTEQKTILQNMLSTTRAEVQKAETNSNSLVSQYFKFKRLSRNARDVSKDKFFDKYGRAPSTSSIDDISELLLIAQAWNRIGRRGGRN